MIRVYDIVTGQRIDEPESAAIESHDCFRRPPAPELQLRTVEVQDEKPRRADYIHKAGVLGSMTHGR